MATSTTHEMLQLREDLWQTRMDTPLPGLTTHAYLWRGPRGNVLFYSPATEADFDAIDALGGVAAQYLSHQDEAGPNLAQIEKRFGRRLHAPEAEIEVIAKHGRVDVPIGTTRHVDDNGVEVLPTPGHSPGSTSYLVTGVGGERYLFTGDTMFPTAEGSWATFLVPGRGDAGQLRESVLLLGTVTPDLVISSAFGGDSAFVVVDEARWAECVAQALASVPS
ncbi:MULTISPECIES: MBL fold metallo-hydrolase [unclassified Mycobacterium]|uniref:MBL fold metallo-hydrolase n=1 Tax=unclassified Mycobacterium TaxID=2642494 RepID=UPI00073FAD83|nr:MULTISPECIES: MBL fold metallo-hydrolase [unclassified Mycobacterium]KUH81110.1 MBL fold metallo-hydrolase [Mycobacterium sp. GA-1999]KUH84121.1 MBL fold metallo-hydrolase [Mycobacterium sp. IS-1556]KUH89986.1 MBL fold metallo-hydrolase [Mycobacterium sp. GA-0227b]